MGWDIYGGAGRSIHIRGAAQLVNSWLLAHDTRTFTSDEQYDRQGLVDFPADCVQRAHAAIPEAFQPDPRKRYAEGDWREARRFLAETAACNEGVSGSY